MRTGNLAYFDTAKQAIGPEHVMASGALPPGFPAVEIEGEHYWDGGLVSNTPLQWLVTDTRVTGEQLPTRSCFRSISGARAESFRATSQKSQPDQKEIQYSSRTRAFTDFIKRLHKVEYSVAVLLDQLPDEFKQSDEARFLASIAKVAPKPGAHLVSWPRR